MKHNTPPPGPARRRPSTLTALARLGAGGWHVARGWWQIRRSFPRLDEAERAQAVQLWARHFLRIWRIELKHHGQPADGPVLIMANHISWLDILVVLASTRCHMVGKAELARWPVLGTLIAGAGTIFIERNTKRDALRVVGEVANALQTRRTVLVFPEGTTSDGLAVLPFHANLFEAALLSDAPIQGLGLSYQCRAMPEHVTAPAYVGDDSLLGSIWRTLRASPFDAHVQFLPLEHGQGRTRRLWARDVQAAIEAARQHLLENRAKHTPDATERR